MSKKTFGRAILSYFVGICGVLRGLKTDLTACSDRQGKKGQDTRAAAINVCASIQVVSTQNTPHSDSGPYAYRCLRSTHDDDEEDETTTDEAQCCHYYSPFRSIIEKE